MEGIVWQRWLVYFVVGVPFLGWLFFTRNQVLRVLAVLGVLIFVQNSFADRRYLFAIGVGPSIIVAYTAFMALFLQRGRLPSLHALGALWAGFLFLAAVAVFIGGVTGGSLGYNIANWQELFLEGLIFFLIGAMAFTKDEELRRFYFLFMVVGLLVSLTHYFTLVTGYRFRDMRGAVDSGQRILYGALFKNSNTQGSFYAMTVPVALAMLLGGRLAPVQRALVATALVSMIGSLILSWHRGGFFVTALLSIVVVASGRSNPVRAFFSLGIGGALVYLGFELVQILVPDLFQAILETKGAKGAETERFAIWAGYLPVVLRNPFGVGLYGQDQLAIAARYGITFVPHNIYLAMSLQIGMLGLACFLGIVGTIVLRSFRAWRRAADRDQQRLVMYTALSVVAFLIVGFAEPVYDNGHKLNNLFWFFAGLSFATSQRVLAQARERSVAPDPALPLEEAPAHGL